ncbi:hypothetical protein GCG54_00007084 [Colletotrichum gloeosporioides]|uniref:Transmembrane protein n=1 Tax=Colletotrichum gloeosporioides TaxID=474922 RepID=A0A8H4CN14_COLGL|nr:uncharacterized protein GCG54_00007084 [Colletotrichum gloeosporioides]KAF3806834.1 hypothetical protein GCG54_00007084 [Colletotrichum gloeosporioides]
MAYIFDWLSGSIDSNSIDEAFRQNLRWFFSCYDDHSSPEDVTRLKRIRAFEPFMLGMSDQQLTTGVTLTIVTMFMTFNNNLSEKFSVFSFQIATRLGYFSCIVHICTISLLREHFDGYESLRTFRVCVVAVLPVLLIICMTISESVTFRFNRHISVKCAKQLFKFIDPDRPHYVALSDEVVVLLIQTVLVLVIVLGYSRRFLELYHKDARADYHYWSRWSLQRLLGELAENNSRPRWNHCLSLEELRISKDDPTVDRWILALDIWTELISTSFLWEIIWLGFYFVFGMGNFWKFYLDTDLTHRMDANFGQVILLILVCILFLSAWVASSCKCFFNALSNLDKPM